MEEINKWEREITNREITNMRKCRKIIHHRLTGHRWNKIHASIFKVKRIQTEEILLKRNYKNKAAYVGPKCKIKLDTKDKRCR